MSREYLLAARLFGRRGRPATPMAIFESGYNRDEMTHHLEATYEQDGVLRLAHPLPLANQQHVRVTVSDSGAPRGRWAVVDNNNGEILLYADTVSKARDRGRTLGRGEPLIQWIPSEPELPSAGL